MKNKMQDGKVAIRRVANLLLCVYTADGVGLGMLRAKVRPSCERSLLSDSLVNPAVCVCTQVEALARYLEEPLKQIASP